MSVNPDALQSILVEMDTQLKQNSAALQAVSTQIAQKEATGKLLKAVVSEIESSTAGDPSASVWEGVGKVFVQSPVEDYTAKLQADEAGAREQLKALKIKSEYLKSSVERTAKSMQAILTGKQQE
jgi:prefoldin subunit 1